MTRCPHCHGTGQTFRNPPTPYPSSQGSSARRMIPYGNGVAAALRAGALEHDVHLYCGTCPVTGKDRWELASTRIGAYGSGSAMVLHENADPAAFRYPAITPGPMGVSVAAFVYGMNRKEQRAVGEALIATGLDDVVLLGGEGCPVEFKAK